MKPFESEEIRNLDVIQEGCLTRYDSKINRLYAFAIEGAGAANSVGENNSGIVLPRMTRANTTGIEQGKFVRMGHKPCCGFFQSGCSPPIQYCPLEFVFEMCSDAQEPVTKPATPVAGTQAEDDVNSLFFTTRNTTTSWAIQNCILRCELTTVDNSVNNNVVSHLLKGGRLRMVYPAYHSAKSSTRLSQMFFTLSNSAVDTNTAAGTFFRKNGLGFSIPWRQRLTI